MTFFLLLPLPLICTSVFQFEMVCATNDGIDEGQLELRLENFSSFANGPIGITKHSPGKHIRGLNWQLLAMITEKDGKKYLSFSVFIYSAEESNVHCAVQATMDIIVGANKVLTKNFQEILIFPKLGLTLRVEIDKLLQKCLSAPTDVVILTAYLKPDPPCGRSFDFCDTLLVKTDELVTAIPIKVNKKLLALHSPFFDRLFFGNSEAGASSSSSSPQPVVEQLDPTTVNNNPIVHIVSPSILTHFKQMNGILLYGDKPILNDDNVEDILRLAKQFEIDEIQGKCGRFLLSAACKLSKLKRFGIASNFGLTATKNLILNAMKSEDFSEGKNFMEFHKEMSQLSEEAQNEVTHRFYQLFPDAPREDGNRMKKQKASIE